MSKTHNAQSVNINSANFSRHADVLVIGGGPAGTWAALSATAKGATVVLVDKGCCGTSGATASAGTGVWYVPPDPAKRLAAMQSREKLGGYLQDRTWMTRVLDRTYESVNLLAEWGQPFPQGDDGVEHRTNLRGPDYMKLMRRKVTRRAFAFSITAPLLNCLLTMTAQLPVRAACGGRKAAPGRCEPRPWSWHRAGARF
jgi:succinate dehydrogenase/fumarate reductase flavoprotein subunit